MIRLDRNDNIREKVGAVKSLEAEKTYKNYKRKLLR